MINRSRILSLPVPGSDCQTPPPDSVDSHNSDLHRTDVPVSTTVPSSTQHPAAEGVHERADRRRSPSDNDATSSRTHDDGESPSASPRALETFFSILPGRAAATISPAEEDALAQRRWRSDAADVEVYLTQLDVAREECAVAGFYAKAQACMQRMEQAVRLFAKRLDAETDAVATRTRSRLAEAHTHQRLELRRRWRDNVAACKRDAATLVAAAEQHKYAQLEREDTQMRLELQHHGGNAANTNSSSNGSPTAAPVWSAEARHLQMELQQLLRQRRYTDAEVVRVQLQRLERQESTNHDRVVTQRHLQRLQSVKASHAAALADMQAVQRQEVHTMVLAGRAALEDLEQDHAAALQRVEDRRQQLHEQTRSVLRAYEGSDVLDPKAAGLKLIRVSQLLWLPPGHTRS